MMYDDLKPEVSILNDVDSDLVQKKVKIKLKKIHEGAIIPEYAKESDSGFDLFSIVTFTLSPDEVIICPTGWKMEIPIGWEIQIRPKSGLSLKTKMRIPNSPSTIDAGYRGEVGIIIENIGSLPIEIKKGQKVAQGVLKRAPQAIFEEVDELSDSDRGIGGYGSSGI